MTASSTGTAEGARTGLVKVILLSGESEGMALYLGSRDTKRKGLTVVPAKTGTHDKRRLYCRHCERSEAIHVSASGRRERLPAQSHFAVARPIPPRQSTRRECPSARAGDFRLHRTRPIAVRRSLRR